MTTPVVPSVVPRSTPTRRVGPGPTGRARPPIPVPALDRGCPVAAGTVYAVSAVDKSGRVADRSIVGVLGWAPGARVSIRERGGTIVLAAAVDGVHRLDDNGRLILPLTVRRWCRLAAGDRLLLAADPAAGVLVGYPFAVLDRLSADAHAAAVGGDAT